MEEEGSGREEIQRKGNDHNGKMSPMADPAITRHTLPTTKKHGHKIKGKSGRASHRGGNGRAGEEEDQGSSGGVAWRRRRVRDKAERAGSRSDKPVSLDEA